jgi:hypothetical protein
MTTAKKPAPEETKNKYVQIVDRSTVYAVKNMIAASGVQSKDTERTNIQETLQIESCSLKERKLPVSEVDFLILPRFWRCA